MNHRLVTKPFETKPFETNSDDPVLGTGLPKLDVSAIHKWRHDVKELIGKYPGPILAISLGAGFLIGWWNKRK